MDPLSIAASSIAISGALSAVLTTALKVTSLKDYHSDIRCQLNDIEDVNIVLDRSMQLLSDRQARGLEEDATVALLLSRLQVVLRQFEKLITKSGHNHDATKRFRWLWQKQRLNALRDNVREAKANLLLALVGTGLNDVAALHFRLDRLEAFAHVSRTENKAVLREILEEWARDQLGVSYRSRATVYAVEEPLPLSDSLGTDVRTIGDSGNSTQNLSDHPVPAHSISEETIVSNTAVFHDTTLSSCGLCCSCKCHHRVRYSTPQVFKNVLGTSLSSIAGLPFGACSERRCQRRQEYTARLTYFFPRWLWPRMVSLSYTSYMGLGLRLRTTRVIDDDAEVLRSTALGDITNLKMLFAQGTASPQDVGALYGLTPLHVRLKGLSTIGAIIKADLAGQVAFFRRDLDVCRFLITAGADPSLETGFRRPVIDIVKDDMLNRRLSPDELSAFKAMFLSMDDHDSLNFSPIHKSVLSISAVPLKCQLELSSALIDAPDLHGCTPLHWAATRCDTEAVKTLLNYGASPNVLSFTRLSPLHHAVEFGSLDCVASLLKAGANVNPQNKRGRSPLHYACRLDDGGRIARLLLDSGAHVNVRDFGQATPIFEAIIHNRAPQVKMLIQEGADFSLANKDGTTPLELGRTGKATDIRMLLIGLNHSLPAPCLTLLKAEEGGMQMNDPVAENLSLQVREEGSSDLTKVYGFRGLYSNKTPLRKSGALKCHEAHGDTDEKFADALEYQGAEHIEFDRTNP